MIEIKNLGVITRAKLFHKYFSEFDRVIFLYYVGIAILLLTIYTPIISISFVGGDDFREIARAHFEDSQKPLAILTTPHDTNRYRPLDRAITLLTYEIGGFEPTAFRLRNVLVHIINSVLVGYLIATFTRNKKNGPIGMLLFGIHPTNAPTVGLAVTTKTLFGFAIIIALLLWLRIWNKKRCTFAEVFILFIVSVIGVLFHEQGLGLILLPIFVCIAVAIGEKKNVIFWCALGIAMSLLIGGTITLGRISAGIVSEMPNINSFGSVLRNILFAFASLFGPIDFLLLFGQFSVTRGRIDFMERPQDHIWQIFFYVSGLLIFVGALTGRLALNIKKLYFIVPVLILSFGLAIVVLPVLLYSQYSELYNYAPSIFAVGLILVLLPLNKVEISKHQRYVSIVMLSLLICSYGCSTLYRNILLYGVAQETRNISIDIPQMISNPDKGAHFILENQPKKDDGYSLYGLQGVGVFEEFGVEPAIQHIYNRRDVTGVLAYDTQSIVSECGKYEDRTVYILLWNDLNKQFSRMDCTSFQP